MDEFPSISPQGNLPDNVENEGTAIKHLQLFDYQLLSGSFDDIVAEAPISAFAAHELFVVIGTADGKVIVVSLSGEILHTWQKHTGQVSAIVVSIDGSLIVSGGSDGHLYYYSTKSDVGYGCDLHSSVLSLAIDSTASRSSPNVYAGLADGSLIMCRRRQHFFKESVIHRGEGPVVALAAAYSLLAAATSYGVRIFDANLEVRLAFVDRPASTTAGGALAQLPPTLHWRIQNDTPVLILSWGDTVLVLRVRSATRMPQMSTSVGPGSAEIIGRVTLCAGNALLGAAPLEDELCMLTAPMTRVTREIVETGVSMTAGEAYPTILVVGVDGRELLYEAMDVFEDCRAADLRLYVSPAVVQPRTDLVEGDSLAYLFPSPRAALGLVYYVVAPKHIVAIRRCNIMEHVEHLVQDDLIEEALHAAESDSTHTLTANHIRALGRRLILSLLQNGDSSRAAQACSDYLGADPNLWQRFVFVFAQAGSLSALVPYIPIQNPRLPDVAYGAVIAHLLATDHVSFEDLISRWPSNLYDPYTVIRTVQDRISRLREAGVAQSALVPLYRALFIINDRIGQRVAALYNLLLIADRSSDEVFTYVRQYSLYQDVQEHIDDLLRLDAEKAALLLASAPEVLAPNFVISQIQNSSRDDHMTRHQVLYIYLSAVEQYSPRSLSPENLDQLLTLIADIEPEKLEAFIERNELIRLPTALRVCRDRGLLSPQVAVLKRMGTDTSHREALEILIAGLRDVRGALDYVLTNGERLWPVLISLASNEATFVRWINQRNDIHHAGYQATAAQTAQCEFVQQLLEQAGSLIHPKHCADLLSMIPATLEIPGLRDRLRDVIGQCHLQVAMRRSTNDLVRADTGHLCSQVIQLKRRGQLIQQARPCDLCHTALFQRGVLLTPVDSEGKNPEMSQLGDCMTRRIILFRCGHAYHGACLFSHQASFTTLLCPQCEATRE